MLEHRIKMATFFLLLGLLNLHFCTTFTLAASTRIGFIQEPRTDKKCYEDGDSGYITTSFNASVQQDRYMVTWNTSPDGTGEWKINGSTILVHDGSVDHQTQEARWMVSMLYRSTSVTYRVKVTSLKFIDESFLIYPLIIDRQTGRIMTYSTVGVKFKVDKDCEDELPSSLAHTQSPDPRMMSTQTNNSSQPLDCDDSVSLSTITDTTGDFLSKLKPLMDTLQRSHNLFTWAIPSSKVMLIIITFINLLQLFCPGLYDIIQNKCRQLWESLMQKMKSNSRNQEMPRLGPGHTSTADNTQLRTGAFLGRDSDPNSEELHVEVDMSQQNLVSQNC